MGTPDRIHREITIKASLEDVWRLVSTPGWWINDGDIIEHESTTLGDVTTLHWKGSDFPVRTVMVDAPRSVTYQWGSGASASPDVRAALEERPSTRVEMTLEEVATGIRVTVVESGFAAHDDVDQSAQTYLENSEGWDKELAAAQSTLER